MKVTLSQLMKQFRTEDDCKRFLMEKRWPDGVVKCPRCGHDKVYALKTRPYHWVCKNVAPEAKCGGRNGYRFSILTGSIFQDTKYPLCTWFQVAFLILTAKKGISAKQIQRTLGSSLTAGKGSYETFWYMAHRLRSAMEHDEFKKLSGVVEVDETYVGGKDRNRHRNKRSGSKGGTFGSGKTGVIGAISRKGNVTCQVIERMDHRTTERFVRQTISEDVSLVCSDENQQYQFVYYGPNAKHEAVNHSRGEYVRGQVHTANLDQFWSLLKRGIMGSFHNVSKKYLPLYINEFSFRHNHRDDAEVFAKVMALA